MSSPAGAFPVWAIEFQPIGGERDMQVPEIVPWLGLGGFFSGCTAIVTLWFGRRDARRAAAAAKAVADETKAVQRVDLIKIAQEAAGAVIADLRTEADRLRERLEEIEAEFATFRKAHDRMVADKEAELALLRGENRELKATIEAYARLLDAHGIPHAPPPRPFFEIRDGRIDPVMVGGPTP